MPRVRVVMMQRDEGDMLLRWLSHYSGLFGFENLSIMDNGSTDPFTLEILRIAEQRGVRIYWDLGTKHDFVNKGGHVANIIRHWDASFDYDFALPVDCDEFLGVLTDDGLATSAAAVLTELDRLRSMRTALRIDMSLFNVPGRPGWFSPDRHFHKGFLPANSLATMDNGYHAPESRHAPGYETTRLVYLHWHNRSFKAVVERARRKLGNLVDVDNCDALIEYEKKPKAPSAHLVKTVLMTPEEYADKYKQELNFFAASPGEGLNFLSHSTWLRPWDPHRYLAANKDVRAYALGPLHHYLKLGFLEGRLLG